MDRKTKAFTGKLPCSPPSTIHFWSKEAPTQQKALCAKKFSNTNLYTGEKMFVSAVLNEESNK